MTKREGCVVKLHLTNQYVISIITNRKPGGNDMSELTIPKVIEVPEASREHSNKIEQIKLFIVSLKDTGQTFFGFDRYGFVRTYADMQTISAIDQLSDKSTIFQLLAEFLAYSTYNPSNGDKDGCEKWFKNKFTQQGVTSAEVLEQLGMEDLESARLLGMCGCGAELTIAQIQEYYSRLQI